MARFNRGGHDPRQMRARRMMGSNNYRRMRSISRGRLYGSPSIFAGDPVEIDQEAADAVMNPTLAPEVIESAVVGDNAPEVAEERVVAYENMSPSARADATVVPAMVVANALLTQVPVLGRIPSTVLNYHYLRCLTDYASAGTIQIVKGADPAASLTTAISFDSTKLPAAETGIKSVPVFKFTISASILNAELGLQYSLICQGHSVSGQEFETDKFTFQRIDYNQAIMGYMVPFQVIATRTVPILAQYGATTGDGTTPDQDSTFTVLVEGSSPTESIAITIPGYAIAETRDIAELFNLPAGVLLK